jgi:hypothetical protein
MAAAAPIASTHLETARIVPTPLLRRRTDATQPDRLKCFMVQTIKQAMQAGPVSLRHALCMVRQRSRAVAPRQKEATYG